MDIAGKARIEYAIKLTPWYPTVVDRRKHRHYTARQPGVRMMKFNDISIVYAASIAWQRQPGKVPDLVVLIDRMDTFRSMVVERINLIDQNGDQAANSPKSHRRRNNLIC